MDQTLNIGISRARLACAATLPVHTAEMVTLERRPDEDDAIISASGVSKSYGAVRAVDNVNFRLGRGQTLTLLGPSGSGKTTTLMILAGLVMPETGAVYLAGKDITYAPSSYRNMGVVFQSYALFPHMSVLENVAFPLRARGVAKKEASQKALAAISMTQLAGLENRLPNELSGGQQQRTALARSFVFRPLVLLMDEALGALDKNLRAQMQLEIKEYQRHMGFSIIHVTHDQEEALTMSDIVAVMSDGQIQQMGSPQDVYDKPRSSFVARFLGDANLIEGIVLGTEDAGVLVETPEGWRLVVGVEGRELSKGARVQICVRPERIRLSKAQGLHHNGGAARITTRRYLGSTVEYLMEDSFGNVIKSKEIPGKVGGYHNCGDAVWLQWEKEDGWVLER